MRGSRRWKSRTSVVTSVAGGAVALSIALFVGAGVGAPSGGAAGAGDPEIGDVSSYPTIRGGRWARGPNLTDPQGNFQARQEHAAVELNGFVYLVGGFVPLEPPPQPTANEPEPFPFAGTGEIVVYTPKGHPSAPASQEGKWSTLPEDSSFPEPHMHHIIAVAHHGKIWAFGGHAGEFVPTDSVYVFTPASSNSPEGSWSRVRVADGKPCTQGSCLRLPRPRAAGAGVSMGDRIYLLGGVEPYDNSPDPVNASIRTTNSVLFLDTGDLPLRWQLAPALREPREHFNAVVRDGRIWVFNGRSEFSTHLRGVESWDPEEAGWRQEQDSPVGTSANVLAAVGDCVYSFGGEFIASNVTGTLINSEVFHVPSGSWRQLESKVASKPLDAAGATSKHGTYGITFVENGRPKIMAPGGAATAWFDPMSKVHVFTPPDGCT